MNEPTPQPATRCLVCEKTFKTTPIPNHYIHSGDDRGIPTYSELCPGSGQSPPQYHQGTGPLCGHILNAKGEQVLMCAHGHEDVIPMVVAAMNGCGRSPSTEKLIGEVDAILAEVRRAAAKFPKWPTDPLHALAVLGEEFGELTKEVVQLTYEPHKSSADEVHKEAIQTAAAAIRFVLSINNYRYTTGPQHSQSTP